MAIDGQFTGLRRPRNAPYFTPAGCRASPTTALHAFAMPLATSLMRGPSMHAGVLTMRSFRSTVTSVTSRVSCFAARLDGAGGGGVRVVALGVLRCPSCGGRRVILAAITEGRVIRAILAALGLPTEAPVVAVARGPPELFEA